MCEETSPSATEITIDLTGDDWEPTVSTRWFAQRGDGPYAFGATPEEALTALLKDFPTSETGNQDNATNS